MIRLDEMYSKMRLDRIYAPVLLIFAVATLYGQFLWSPIQFDDRYFFMVDSSGGMPISVFHYSMFQLRSLPYATLAWTTELFGLDLINFRVGNLLLHAAVALSLFYFLKTIFSELCGNQFKESLSPSSTAFFAALIFAVHPVASYAAGYLVQRSIVMATLFSLLSMLFYMHGSIRKKPLLVWGCVPLYFLAVFSKEHAIMLPFVLLALTMLLHENWQLKLKQRWGVFAALITIAIFVIWVKKNILGVVYEQEAQHMLQQFEGSDLAYPLSVITQSWLFFKYAALWLLPNPSWLSIDMRESFAHSLSSIYLIAAVGFLGWGGGAFWLLRKRGMVGLLGFGLLFPWLMFITEFSSVRIQEPFVLYRSYLWAVGAFCVFPYIVHRLNMRMATVILLAIALVMFPISMERLLTLSNSVMLWRDAQKLVKGRDDLLGADRIYYNSGTELLRIDRPNEAIPDLQQAVRLNDQNWEAYWNLGVAYSKTDNWSRAVDAFSKCVELNPDKPHWKFYHGRAIAFEKMGQLQRAQEDYRRACQLGKRGCEKLTGGDVNLSKKN